MAGASFILKPTVVFFVSVVVLLSLLLLIEVEHRRSLGKQNAAARLSRLACRVEHLDH
jgi:hypothetical protein